MTTFNFEVFFDRAIKATTIGDVTPVTLQIQCTGASRGYVKLDCAASDIQVGGTGTPDLDALGILRIFPPGGPQLAMIIDHARYISFGNRVEFFFTGQFLDPIVA